MRERQSLYALNRGLVSRYGLARVDVKRLALAAETFTNWTPRVLGNMTLRAGLGYIGGILTNKVERLLKFVFSTDDTAVLELTDSVMRVWINDTLLTRPAVSTAIVGGDFATGALSGWDASSTEAGSTVGWDSPGYLTLLGNGTAQAIIKQQITVAVNDRGVEHGIKVVVARGPVMIRLGSTDGGDEYLKEASLNTGTHSLSIVPTGDFWVRLFSSSKTVVWVDTCMIEGAGFVGLPTPWLAADLDNLRIDQSADVVFVACKGYQQRRIERRGTRPNARSWSVCLYTTNDGPFNIRNIGTTKIHPSATSGNVTITADHSLFKSTHVGALWSITSIGQLVTVSGATTGVYTDSIRVVGVGNDRAFTVDITGIAAASTVSLERSYDDSNWIATGPPNVWTSNQTAVGENDGLDNQIVYYRLYLTARVAPDTVVMTLTYGGGSKRGIARITDYTSATVVGAEVLKSFGGTDWSDNWQEGKWSDYAGWPTAVKLHEGRLWWSGINGIFGSVSDAYDSYDETNVGAAGPINRTIGSGPVDTVNWLLSLKGLLLGAQGSEYSVRASSLDEPLTPTNFNVKQSSTQGSGSVDAIKIDQSGYFVNRASTKVFELAFDIRNYDYQSANLMELCPEIGLAKIVRMDVQRLPDTRLHCVLEDGTVIVAVSNKPEEVLAWGVVETNGFVEDVLVLPALDGDLDDQVYYVVKRHINGSDVRYLEKFAQEIDCRGGKISKQADCHVVISGTSGLSHLEGEEVVVWADGVDQGTDDSSRPWTQRFTVVGGALSPAIPYTNATVGLAYTAQFKSGKLGLQPQGGSSLNQQKRSNHIGLILADTHRKGLQFGGDFDTLDDMPEMEDGTQIPTEVVEVYDQNLIEFPGRWTTDQRVCLVAQAPRPANVMAVTSDIEATG